MSSTGKSEYRLFELAAKKVYELSKVLDTLDHLGSFPLASKAVANELYRMNDVVQASYRRQTGETK